MKIKTDSLQPGFLVIYYDPSRFDPKDLMMSPKEVRELKEKGFYGGIILTHGIKLETLTPEDLASVGLMRINGLSQ